MLSTLSDDNKRWLAEKLIEQSEHSRLKKCGLDEAMEDIRQGRVIDYASVDDFFGKMGI